MSVNREPAIRRPNHPAADLPGRPSAAPPPVAKVAPPSSGGDERLTEQHNVRIRPTTKKRLTKAVDKLRYETGDRTISIASITDSAIEEYLEKRGC